MRAGGFTAILLGALVAPAAAQSPQLAEACESFSTLPEAHERCLDVAATIELFQPETGILLAGANPVLGTAAPLGTRAGVPRISLGGRINVVFIDVPDVFEPFGSTAQKSLELVVPLPQAELGLGLFSGFSLAPSVGGFGALDFLASVSLIPAVGDLQGTKLAWGVGGRLGILDESFLLPGVSVSLLHRDLGRIEVGSLNQGDEAEFATDLRVLSVRAAASKTLLAVGVAAGVGWDRYRSDIEFRFVNPASPGSVETVFARDAPGELETGRWSLFGEFRVTFTVVHLVGQAGFQERGTLLLGDGATDATSGGIFGGVGVRLGL